MISTIFTVNLSRVLTGGGSKTYKILHFEKRDSLLKVLSFAKKKWLNFTWLNWVHIRHIGPLAKSCMIGVVIILWIFKIEFSQIVSAFRDILIFKILQCVFWLTWAKWYVSMSPVFRKSLIKNVCSFLLIEWKNLLK